MSIRSRRRSTRDDLRCRCALYRTTAGGAGSSRSSSIACGRLPGVESVGLAIARRSPAAAAATSFWVPAAAEARVTAAIRSWASHWATPGYFSTLRINVLAGPKFHRSRSGGQPNVVLVNETAARTFWPNDTPIGKIDRRRPRRLPDGCRSRRCRVRRAVQHDRDRLEPGRVRAVRAVLSGRACGSSSAAGSMTSLSSPRSGRRCGRSIPSLPLSEVKTMDERVGDAMWRTRVAAWLFSAFAGLALLLTAVGIFGVMSQTVSQRTPEIGVRMALGAQGDDVLGLVLGRAGVLTGIGIAAGIAIALGADARDDRAALRNGAGRSVDTRFVALLLGVVALAACYFPAAARRASIRLWHCDTSESLYVFRYSVFLMNDLRYAFAACRRLPPSRSSPSSRSRSASARRRQSSACSMRSC